WARARSAPSRGIRRSVSPRRRTRTCSGASMTLSASAVGFVLASPLAGVGLGGAGRNQLVEERALPVLVPQYTAQALDVLPNRAAAANDHRHIGVGDVDALVQHLGRDHGAVASRREAFEDFAALP